MTDSPNSDRPDNRQQPKPPKPQFLNPETAAKKLGVYLPATPTEFQANPISRDDVAALQASPPAWLVDLRKNGPHPRGEVARRLEVSNSGLVRAGITEALTSDEIKALIADPPAWLVNERAKSAGESRS